MAVQSVNKISSDLTASSKDGRIWTEKYRVIFDNLNSSAIDAINAAGIPLDFATHPLDSFATLRAKRCAYEVEDASLRHVRIVECRYETKAQDEDPNEDGNPLLWPAKWSGSFQQFQTDLDSDADGKPVLNIVGQPFQILPPKDDSRPIIQCRKNFPTFDASNWLELKDKINSTAWGGIPAKCAKIQNVTFNEQYHDGFTPYYQTTWTFALRFDIDPNDPAANITIGWDKAILNVGHYQWVDPLATPAVLEPIKKNGEWYNPPLMLDGAGRAIIPDGTDQSSQAGYQIVRVYKMIDFNSVLPIPTPINKT